MGCCRQCIKQDGLDAPCHGKGLNKEQLLETVKRPGIGNCRNSDVGGQGQALCVQKNETVLGTSCKEI